MITPKPTAKPTDTRGPDTDLVRSPHPVKVARSVEAVGARCPLRREEYGGNGGRAGGGCSVSRRAAGAARAGGWNDRHHANARSPRRDGSAGLIARQSS